MELTFDLGAGDERLFIDESLEQIERIESGLLELERGNADPGTVNEVFRAAHTLKGSAATIRHTRMAELTHAMEDVFGALRSETIPAIGPFADVVLSTIDVLRALVEEVTVGRVLTDAPPDLTRQLRERLAEATGAAATGAAATRAGAGSRAGAPSGAGVPSGATAEAPSASSSPTTDSTVHPNSTGHPASDRQRAAVERLVQDAPATDGPLSILACAVDPACEWQGVRLFQALMEATESGRLIASVPTSDEIEAGFSDLDLVILLTGAPGDHAAVVERVRSVDDIVHVTVSALDRGPSAGETAAAPKAGAPATKAARAVDASTPDDKSDERRKADLGVEARGLPVEERVALAGDRLRLAQQTIRIDVGRLDELMNLVGELVVQKTRLQLQAQRLMGTLGDDPLARDAESGAQQFARIASQIQDQVTGLRMLPIETVFNRFPRVVRDLAAKLGRDVDLVIEGGETELDRSVLEEVGDPLGHLVRNALDHGIEPADVRVAAGKPPRGRLRLGARHAEGMIVITVEDDGAGMDAADLRQKGVEKGLLTAEAAAAMSDADALKIIFLPGFSTAARITDVSGRGVGMDVVRTNIERLGGRVEVVSSRGTGTQIVLSLPLTLAIVSAMLVRSGERTCALPLTGVVETLRVQPASIGRVQGHPMITLRGRVVPVAVLDDALGDPPRALVANDRGFVNVVVVRSREAEIALAVDEFVGQQEIVLKSMSVFTGRLRGISGATILADGSVALVVDIPALFDVAPRGRAAA